MLFLSKPTTRRTGKQPNVSHVIETKKKTYKYNVDTRCYFKRFSYLLLSHINAINMKFSAIALLGSLIAGASALQNFQTADKQLNISSPLLNGIYVAGQILPLSYTPLESSK